jgi:hypothetical protein
MICQRGHVPDRKTSLKNRAEAQPLGQSLMVFQVNRHSKLPAFPLDHYQSCCLKQMQSVVALPEATTLKRKRCVVVKVVRIG